MATRKIVMQDDEALRKVCKSVDIFDKNLHTLLDDLKETLAIAKGLGLAAPQVAVIKRACIIVDNERGNTNVIEMVNPKILQASKGQVVEIEGCLSVRGIDGKSDYQKVARPKWITAEWQDRSGNVQQRKFKGYIARAVCHEIDHLDGILYIDKIFKEEKEGSK